MPLATPLSAALWLAAIDPVLGGEAGSPSSLDEDDRPGAARAPAGKPLEGRVIETLVKFDEISVRVETDAVPGEQRETTEAAIDVRAAMSHDFDGPIYDLELGVAVLPRPELDFAWDRLHTPPLRLTLEEIERKMPYPVAVITVPGDETPLAPATIEEVAVRERYDAMDQPADGPLAYLVALSGYSLAAPSERDILRILRAGGPADLSALARWAGATASEGTSAPDEAACGRIMDTVEGEIRRLRAPPAFADFQRLNAITAIILVCERPEDLERVLTLQRPMTILLSAAQVSYDIAANEESVLGVSVHGFRRLQSRSDSAVAWEGALRRLRDAALDRLVRLAFEPIDFRDAPAHMQRRAVLQNPAAQLLSPLTTTQVERVVAAAAERPQMQRELLRFYVEVRHAAAIEPLVAWLIDNPRDLDDFGVEAVEAIGDLMLPVLLRRFDDAGASMTERMTVWRLLAVMPEKHAAQLEGLARSMGVDLGARGGVGADADADINGLLEALREHDERVQTDRIEDLVRELATPATAVPALRIQVTAARRLAEAAPSRAEAIADAIIDAHVAAARALDDELSGESRAVLRQLRDLPLGTRHADAARAATITGAELAADTNEFDPALGSLEKFDPALADPEIRAAYLGILGRRYDDLIAMKAWDDLDGLLDRADVVVSDEFDVDARRSDILERRRAPLRIIGGVVGVGLAIVLLAALHMYGVFAAIRRPFVAWRERVAERRRASALEYEPDATPDPVDDPDVAVDQADDDDDDGIDTDPVDEIVPNPSVDVAIADPEDPPGTDAAAEAARDAAVEAARDAAVEAARDPPVSELLGDSWSANDGDRSPLDDFAA